MSILLTRGGRTKRYRAKLLNPGSQYWEQGFYRRTASDLAYHQRNLKAKVGSWHHQGVDFSDFFMCSGMCSKLVLRLVGAIPNAFCTILGLICRRAAQNEIFKKCAKIGSVSGECFAPICAHVSRRHVHSVLLKALCTCLRLT